MKNQKQAIMKNPEQPPMSDWKFIEELKKPLHDYVSLERTKKGIKEADLSMLLAW